MDYSHPPTDLKMEPAVDKFTVEFDFEPDEAYLYRLHCWRLYEPAIVLIVTQVFVSLWNTVSKALREDKQHGLILKGRVYAMPIQDADFYRASC